MFGRMMIEPVVQLNPSVDLQTAVSALTRVTDNVEIVRCVDFEDEEFGGYSINQLEMLLNECNFLDLVERPGLWRSGLRWLVVAREAPRDVRLTEKIFRVIYRHAMGALLWEANLKTPPEDAGKEVISQ